MSDARVVVIGDNAAKWTFVSILHGENIWTASLHGMEVFWRGSRAADEVVNAVRYRTTDHHTVDP